MEIRDAIEGRRGRARIAGLVAARRAAASKTGPMEFVTIEDETDLLEVVLFPRAKRLHGAKIDALGPYIFEGDLRREGRSAHLDVRDVSAVAPRGDGSGAGLIAAGDARGEPAALPGRSGARRG